MSALHADLLGIDDPRWSDALARLRHDIYHLPEYVGFASRRHELGTPAGAIVEGDGDLMFLPLILRDIPYEVADGQGLRDAVSSRFFPGPLVQVTPGHDIELFGRQAIEALRACLAEAGVVSAYVRFHPLLTPRLHAFGEYGPVVQHGETISVDLALSPEELWGQTRANHRRDINRARRDGYVFRVDESLEHLEAFVDIYDQTMRRVGSDDVWRLSRDWFADLLEAVGGVLHLAVVEHRGELASAAFITEVDGIIEYHLGGTHDSHLAARPSKLLIHETTSWGKERGSSVFHLAGSLRSGDSLQHFKLGFSPRLHPMSSWRIVTDRPRYDDLVKRRGGASDHQPDPSNAYFPAYRKMVG